MRIEKANMTVVEREAREYIIGENALDKNPSMAITKSAGCEGFELIGAIDKNLESKFRGVEKSAEERRGQKSCFHSILSYTVIVRWVCLTID